MTINDVMHAVNNYFEYAYKDGTFAVNAGTLEMVGAPENGDYVAIDGSIRCDGAWKQGEIGNGATDEFTGRVWFLKPPMGFVELAEEIITYCEQHPQNGIQSETFGNYSRTMATGKNGAVSWQEVFFDRLTPYRHMFTEVCC